MAEQEVIKHTRKLFGIWETKNPIWHKIGQFFFEIFIIIFAITVSIYFHDRSVLKHQRHETKEFLLGLKQDLATDIEEMNQDKNSFMQSEKAFYYITSRKLEEPLNADTINKYYGYIFNTTGLVPNSGRLRVLNPRVRWGPSRIKNYKIISWICTRKIFPISLIVRISILQKNWDCLNMLI